MEDTLRTRAYFVAAPLKTEPGYFVTLTATGIYDPGNYCNHEPLTQCGANPCWDLTELKCVCEPSLSSSTDPVAT